MGAVTLALDELVACHIRVAVEVEPASLGQEAERVSGASTYQNGHSGLVVVPNPNAFHCRVRGRFAVPRSDMEDQYVAAAERLTAAGENVHPLVAYQPVRARTLRFLRGKVVTPAALKRRVETAADRGEVFSLGLNNPPGSRGQYGDRIGFSFVGMGEPSPEFDARIDWTDADLQNPVLVDLVVSTVGRFVSRAGVVAGAGWFGAHQLEVDPYLGVTVEQGWSPHRDELVGYSLLVVLPEPVIARLGGPDAISRLPAEVRTDVREPDGSRAVIAVLRRRPAEIDTELLSEWRRALSPALRPQARYRARYVSPRPWMIVPEDWPEGSPDGLWRTLHC
jgi:hypothetical protein